MVPTLQRSAVSAQGLMCGVSTRFNVRCQHKDKSAVSALGSSMSNSVVSTLFSGYGVSTLILCGINTREQAVSVLFGCTVIVQTVV